MTDLIYIEEQTIYEKELKKLRELGIITDDKIREVLKSAIHEAFMQGWLIENNKKPIQERKQYGTHNPWCDSKVLQHQH